MLNTEALEHTEHLQKFLSARGGLVGPGVILVVATINRTLAAFVIVRAEYVLRWLPQGAHHWRKLVKPVEVTAGLGEQFSPVHRTGVRVNPLDRSFHYTGNEGVNYMLHLQKAPV